MSMNALSSCMYVSSVHAGTGGDQKKAPDPLGLEFQAAVCHHIGAGIQEQQVL